MEEIKKSAKKIVDELLQDVNKEEDLFIRLNDLLNNKQELCGLVGVIVKIFNSTNKNKKLQKEDYFKLVLASIVELEVAKLIEIK